MDPAFEYDAALADAKQLAAIHTDMGQWAHGLVYARMGHKAEALRAARDLERRALHLESRTASKCRETGGAG